MGTCNPLFMVNVFPIELFHRKYLGAFLAWMAVFLDEGVYFPLTPISALIPYNMHNKCGKLPNAYLIFWICDMAMSYEILVVFYRMSVCVMDILTFWIVFLST